VTSDITKSVEVQGPDSTEKDDKNQRSSVGRIKVAIERGVRRDRGANVQSDRLK
jgi:hypothetical protein